MNSEEPPNRHERRRLRTQNQLKQAAMELLLEKGYDTITVQDITDRADLGRGTFYIYFKDKEDIVWSIIQEGLDAADREAHQQYEKMQPPHPELFGYTNIFRHAQQNRDLYHVMLGSRGSAPLTARVQDYLADDFARELKDIPLFSHIDVPMEVLSQVLTGAIIRLVIWWLSTPNDYTPEQMAAMLFEVLHHRQPPPGDQVSS